MKELWPSLTTVEPATIYPPEEGRGVDFAGHKRGGMKGDVCVHVKGPRTRWVCKVVAVAWQGGRENRRTNCRESKGPPSLCGERILSSNGDCEMERILLETIELVTPL